MHASPTTLAASALVLAISLGAPAGSAAQIGPTITRDYELYSLTAPATVGAPGVWGLPDPVVFYPPGPPFNDPLLHPFDPADDSIDLGYFEFAIPGGTSSVAVTAVDRLGFPTNVAISFFHYRSFPTESQCPGPMGSPCEILRRENSSPTLTCKRGSGTLEVPFQGPAGYSKVVAIHVLPPWSVPRDDLIGEPGSPCDTRNISPQGTVTIRFLG